MRHHDTRAGKHRWARRLALLLVWMAALAPAFGMAAGSGELRIGSKRFTESYILAEILAQAVQARTGHKPAVAPGLGNTAIVYAALRSGNIDVYPEYAGTIALEILKSAGPLGLEEMRARLAPLGLGVGVPFGFNDGYALAMRASVADRLGIRTLGDLARHPELKLGLTSEFIGRADGWQGLAQRYGLPQRPTGLDHGIAYEAIQKGQVDVIDIYTTDSKIKSLGLKVLDDDLRYFPRYDALLLYRLDVPQRFPQAWAAMQALAGTIDENAMIGMNGRAELDGVPFDRIAHDWLASRDAGSPGKDGSARASQAGGNGNGNGSGSGSVNDDGDGDGNGNGDGNATAPGHAHGLAAIWSSFWTRLAGPDFGRLAWQHLILVVVSVTVATLIAIPAGLAVLGRPRLRGFVLGGAGLLQTVPSLAMLAVLISVTGVIGTAPALVALMLYALLPIMRNTCVGLEEVPQGLRMAAVALGMTRRQQLLLVELPLARPTIVAGVRVATSIAIGTATIAAFIGAGGFGERIVTGLALNDRYLLLAGAVPVAVMALLSEVLFEGIERTLRRRQGRSVDP
jgi:osmoprotectant transport system permease protein